MEGIDGSQHNRDENLKRDAERDAWLQSQDYVVLRFWNHEIFTSLDVAILAISTYKKSKTK